MRNTATSRIWCLFLSLMIASAMLFTLPVISYAEDGAEDKWTEENTVEIENAEMLHALFDKINETNVYGSLKVILTADIKTDKGIRFNTNRADNELLLDLNGHSITVESDDIVNYHVLQVSGKANVTITGNGSLISTCDGEMDSPSAVMVYGGNVTIENGTYDAKLPINTNPSGEEDESVSVVINGGTFIGKTPLTVSGADVTVNDGSFVCKRYDSADEYEDYNSGIRVNYSSGNDRSGNLIVNGGSFDNMVAGKGTIFDCTGNLSIVGGTFASPALLSGNSWYFEPDMSYSISGGDFTNVNSIFQFGVEPLPSTVLSVTGGTFTDDQKKELEESNKLGDADFAKGADLANYWQEEIPECVYTGKALRPNIEMDVTLSSGDMPLEYMHRFSYKTTYSNNTKIGLATVTFTGQGDLKGTAKAVFKILPQRAAFKSVKGAKKSINVKVKSQKGGVKYQIQYKTGKAKWKTKTASKTSLTIKKLKAKKKYQVRVRAFKKVSGKNYYGAWSKTKTIKTK